MLTEANFAKRAFLLLIIEVLRPPLQTTEGEEFQHFFLSTEANLEEK